MPSSAKPRVLVTRSRHQTSDLASQLRSLGMEPILIPTISIAPPQSFAVLDAALTHLGTFHWLVFTSANAVRSFAERLPPTTAAIVTPRVAAIGPATAQALEAVGISPDLVPPQAVAESLAQALLPHITRGHTRTLLIRAEAARDILPDTLRDAGAHLTIAPAYRNLIPQSSIQPLQDLFSTSQTWPDAITFTSSSTVSNLFAILEAANLKLPDGRAHGKTILRASIGPITSQTLRDLGYPPHLEAPQPTMAALAQTLAHQLGL